MARGAKSPLMCASLVAAACVLLLPVSGKSAASLPDFSGIWGRNSVDYEPPPSGPGPVMNKTRTFYMRIGDDANPILKPEAAEKVRQGAPALRPGGDFPPPRNGGAPAP